MELKGFIERTAPLRILGVKITQDGSLTAEHFWDEECRRNLYSASKSVTSCAVGFAVQEGLVALDEKLVDAFAEDLPEQVSPQLEHAVVRDLLTMCLGQESGSLMGAQRPLYQEDDWAKLALAIPFVYEPGERFVYNNVGPYLAGLLVQRRAGCDLVSYLTPRLFRKLGIKRPTWESDPLGNTFGAGGLFLTLSELHRFGKFYLQMGKWAGQQLLSEQWVLESTSKQVENNRDEFGYGYLFWGGPHGSFRADGKYSQLSVILREKNAVISVVAECRRGKELQQAIWEELYPQL
ncbi:MAG: serine hydrolase [Oscillospiraceae bacterium]|nr:serine hydrolase [Oscillospiraceae bacterium]